MRTNPLCWSLLLAFASLFAAAASAQTSLISEDFSTATGTTPPTGWTNNQISGAAGELWAFNNPGGQTLNAPITSPAAIFDSDFYGNNAPAEDCALESPTFDASAYTVITLSWDQYFQAGFGGAVSVEVFNGTTWTSVFSASASSTPNPDSQSLDITTEAGGSAVAQVRFHWTGNWSWWWIVDNVNVDGTNIGFSVTTGATTIPNGGSISALDGSALSALSLSFDATGTNSPGTITSVVTNSSLITGFTQSEWDASGSFPLQATPTSGSFNGLGTINVAITVTDNASGTLNYSFDIDVVNTLSLTTTFAGGNGCGGGNMFDITAANNVEITAFDVNTSSTAATTVDIYYIANGTYLGNQTTAGSWTLLESVSTTGAGTGNPTNVPLTTPLAIPAGSTYAIYVYYDAQYTNGSGTLNDANITLTYGDGLCGQFNSVNTGREFNGTVYYTLPAPSAPTITSTAPTAAFSGNAYSYTPTATGNPTPSFSISPDPATLGSGWLTWNGTTLSGTPGTGDIGIDIGPLTLTATNGVNPDATEVFTVTVSAPSPEIEVLDPNSTSVTSGATMTVYAATAGASSTGTFTINNTGSNPLNFSGTPIVDKGSSENNCTVTVTQPTTNPLPATTGTDTFALDIVPTAAGTFSFSVTILSDDADEGTFVINFTGEAKATAEQEIAVWDQNSASIANGGTYTENNTGTAQFNSPFTVRNEGGAALNLTGTTAVAVSGQNNCTVVINQPASTTMAAAGTWLATSQAFSFDITPTAAGAFSFTVTIDNNDTDEGTFTYTFSGNTATPSSGGGSGGGGGGCSTGGDSPYSWMVLLGLLSAFVVFTRMRSSKA